jgi:hypothetical protein
MDGAFGCRTSLLRARAQTSHTPATPPHVVTAKQPLMSVAAREHQPRCFADAQIHRVDAGYRLGSDRGSPKDGSVLFSKRVMPQIRSPVRVST